MGKNEVQVYASPNLAVLEDFWRNIFKSPVKANLESSCLSDLQDKLKDKLFAVKEPVIDEICFDGCASGLCNWAASGPDGIQGFWIKQFTALKPVILSHFNSMLENGSLIPSQFPRGRTILIPKASDTIQPKNFHPITCLNVLYKLWTGCIGELVLRHFAVNSVLHLYRRRVLGVSFDALTIFS